MEHKCGIIGIIDTSGNNIIKQLINGLHNLQHRGYESAGISYINNGIVETHKNIGLVADVFHDFKAIPSSMGMGHVRYSTTKKDKNKFLEEAQPISNDLFSVAHNGNIPFIQKIKEEYSIESTNNSDTYILVKLMELLAEKYANFEDVLKHIVNRISGTYALIIMTKEKLYGVRDRYGIRPLTLLENKIVNTLCLTSETVALGNVGDVDNAGDAGDAGYRIIREINPGEIIVLDRSNKWQTIYQHTETNYSFCSFEYIYFMHFKSEYGNNKIEDVRYRLGYELGLREKDVYDNCIVIPVPNSSISSADGFACAIGSVSMQYIFRNDDVKRTFILPTNEERKHACSKKFSFTRCGEITNRNVYLIDDSIVRGTTIKYIINQLKVFNPLTINIRITSPPVVGQCYYGIDMSTKDELIITNRNIEMIRDELGVSSLCYIDIETMKKVFGHSVCTSCFTGQYDSKLLDW